MMSKPKQNLKVKSEGCSACPFYIASPRISTEFKDCSMPLAFDQHKNCSYKCIFCFAYYQRNTDAKSREDYGVGKVAKVDINKWLELFEGKKKNGKPLAGLFKFYWDNFISKRKVIQWGALGDPFCNFERNMGTGLPLLQKLADLKYPVSFSTKSTWFTKDKRYMDIFKQSPKTFHFKFSIITSDAKKAALIEQEVDSPAERFAAMRRLHDIGCPVTLRLRPYIIGLTDLDIQKTIESAATAGAHSVSMEFFCLEMRASFNLKQRYLKMSKVLGFDIVQFYKKNSISKGYLRLNRQLKSKYMAQLQALCAKNKLKLYVSDPDFKEISAHGSCCGLPQTPEFENYMKAQWLELLVWMRDNNKETITWTEYEAMYKDDFEWQKGLPIRAVCNFGSAKKHAQHRSQTIFDFNKNTWNDPNKGSSPYKYFGGLLEPQGKDDKGDIIYKINKKIFNKTTTQHYDASMSSMEAK